MTNIEQTYLQLLRKAIGLSVDDAQCIYSVGNAQCTMHGEDIKAVVQVAQRQGTGPLVFNQILSVNDAQCTMHDNLRMQMKQVCLQNMMSQEEMKGVMQKTLAALADGGVHAVVFKGFALAQLYPNPYLRQWGDIDIYVGDKGYHQAADILRKTWPNCPCFEEEEDYFKHWNINVGHTAIEAHRVTIAMTHPRDKRIWTRLENSGLYPGQEIDGDGLTIHVPEENFNVLLVFIHSWHHYTESRSANMKQVCDVAMCLKHLKDPSVGFPQRATGYLKKNLRRLRLMQVWEAYAWIMVERLGLPANQCPLYTPKAAKRGELLLQRIMEGRVHKAKNDKGKVSSNIILRKLHTLSSKIQDSLQLWEISPIYAMHDIMGKILEGLGRILMGEINRKWE